MYDTYFYDFLFWFENDLSFKNDFIWFWCETTIHWQSSIWTIQRTLASTIKHSFYSHYFKTFTFHLKEFNRIFFNFHKLMFMCYKSYHQPEQILPTSFPMSNILVIVVIVSLIHWCVPFTIHHVVVKEILIAVDDMSLLCTHNLNHRCDDDDGY